MEHKVFRLAIKELNDTEAPGKLKGYLSVFGNVDRGGDVIEPGAFTKTLAENDAFAMLWSHSAQEPKLVVGAFKGAEDRRGLFIEGDFFVNQPGGADAYGVVKELHERGVKVGLSIGYEALKWEFEQRGDEKVRRISEIKLYEGSITLFPMNEQALIQAVKDGKNVVDADTKGKVVKVVCGDCGKTVMEIIDPAAVGGEALDAREPADATPKTEPPPENAVLNALGSLLERATRDLGKI